MSFHFSIFLGKFSYSSSSVMPWFLSSTTNQFFRQTHVSNVFTAIELLHFVSTFPADFDTTMDIRGVSISRAILESTRYVFSFDFHQPKYQNVDNDHLNYYLRWPYLDSNKVY